MIHSPISRNTLLGMSGMMLANELVFNGLSSQTFCASRTAPIQRPLQLSIVRGIFVFDAEVMRLT